MVTRSNRATVVVAAAVCALLGAAGSATAQVLPYGPTLYRVTATTYLPSGQVEYSSSVEWSSNDGNYSSDPAFHTGNDGLWTGYDHYTWYMTIPTEIRASNGTLLGRVNNLGIVVDADPFVTTNFNVTAGALNTTFGFSSSTLGVAPTIYTGQASAQVDVTDNDGDGATLAVTAGTGLYRAQYNGATLFTQLLPTLVAGSFSGASQNASFGPVGIGPVLTDISGKFDFSLTPNDTATGTSVFNVIPGPGSFALLGLGGLVAARRRRTR